MSVHKNKVAITAPTGLLNGWLLQTVQSSMMTVRQLPATIPQFSVVGTGLFTQRLFWRGHSSLSVRKLYAAGFVGLLYNQMVLLCRVQTSPERCLRLTATPKLGVVKKPSENMPSGNSSMGVGNVRMIRSVLSVIGVALGYYGPRSTGS